MSVRFSLVWWCLLVSAAVPAQSAEAEVLPVDLTISYLGRHKLFDGIENSLGREIGAHLQAYRAGQEKLRDYPYLPAIMELVHGDLSPRALRGFIAEGADVNARDARGYSAFERQLLHAQGGHQVEACRVLMEAGAKVYEPPALIAAMLGDTDALAKMGFDELSAHGTGGYTALHVLALRNDATAIAALPPLSSLLNLTDAQGLTPLAAAICKRYNWTGDGVDVLLAAGADANLPDAQGLTPLHHATHRVDSRAVRSLLAAGANPSARDAQGRSPLMCFDAGWVDPGEIILPLLEAGGDVNAADNDGNTTLHGAAQRKLGRFAKVLLAAGADATAKNARGETPLDIARRAPNPDADMVELLTRMTNDE